MPRLRLATVLGITTALLFPGTYAAASPSVPARSTTATATATATAAAPSASADAAVTAPAPYTAPSFAGDCDWHHFGEGEWPPVWLWGADPLCVEYEKRDITTDNGGALAFLLAEPSRFALAFSTCRYYQKDHWSVQDSVGDTPHIAWDGEYWFDRKERRAGAHLTNFRVEGQTAGIGDVVQALRPYFPEIADHLDDYGSEYGETGLSATLPFDLGCALSG